MPQLKYVQEFIKVSGRELRLASMDSTFTSQPLTGATGGSMKTKSRFPIVHCRASGEHTYGRRADVPLGLETATEASRLQMFA